MYIPAWILVIVIAAVAFYYFRKHKNGRSQAIHPFIKTAMEKNNGNPTYDQMFKMNEEEFKKWLMLRNETDRAKLLEEMIDHEERTGSFRKTARKEISGSEQAILDVFDIDKSVRIVRTFGKVKSALTEDEKEGIDLVEHAIFVKGASDYVLLNVGDSVLVKSKGKAEIIEISVSSDGYKKYKVEFEDKSDSLDLSLKQEWFLSNDLVRFHSQKNE